MHRALELSRRNRLVAISAIAMFAIRVSCDILINVCVPMKLIIILFLPGKKLAKDLAVCLEEMNVSIIY